MVRLQNFASKCVLFQAVLLMVVLLLMGIHISAAQAASFFDAPYSISELQILDNVVADFNNDGLLDLAGGGVSVFSSNGDGTFASTSYPSGVSLATSITSGDFDNDGDVDLATLDNTSDSFSVLLNDGNGIFNAGSLYDTGFDPVKISSGDFDNDGDVDLSVAVYDVTRSGGAEGDPGIQMYSNDGNGSFVLGTLVRTATYISDFDVADFDGDGDVDIITGSDLGVAKYTVIKNQSNGIFTSVEKILYNATPEFAPHIFDLISSDIDNDGDSDIVATFYGGIDVVSLVTLVNNGSGAFSLEQTVIATEPYLHKVIAADFDGDGDSDLITSGWGNNQIYLLRNNGQGLFGNLELQADIPDLNFVTAFNVADLNSDGKNDLIISSDAQVGTVAMIRTNTGNPTPSEQANNLVANVITLHLSNNIENSYLANLYKVEAFIEGNQKNAAINQLNAFIIKVNQDYNQGKITQQVRSDLVTFAQQLIFDLTN